MVTPLIILAITVVVGLIGFYLRHGQETRIYIDYSGSMHCFRDEVEVELAKLKKWFFFNGFVQLFDDRVHPPTRFTRSYKLPNNYGGGTEIKNVLADFNLSGAKRAIIITDGCFMEPDEPLPSNVHMVAVGDFYKPMKRDPLPTHPAKRHLLKKP